MKKFLLMFVMLFGMQAAMADSSANIKIKIRGALRDNRYFLCVQNIGCLSILAASKGKVFPIFHAFDMDNIFVTDVNNNFRVYPQGLPSSCNVSVQENHTLTITGSINASSNGKVQIKQLHCNVI